MEEFSRKKLPTPLLISFDAEELRKQAAASTQRFKEGITGFNRQSLLMLSVLKFSLPILSKWILFIPYASL